uniref:Uncharacterized protein n=1 Tax=Vespula pensylvanica TaxID=30213 RepID=A0A834PBL3_VESPE|nr:hypothetical protein H0235_002755 [Vespula pensylvanica]
MIALCLTPALNSEYDTNIDISINDFVESSVKLLRTFRETRNRNGTVRVKIVVSFTIELAVVSLPVSNKSERPQTAGISSPYSRWRLAREESSPDEQQNEVGSRVFVRVQGECTSFERIIQLPIPSFELQKHRSVEPPCRILRDHLSVSIRGMPEGRLTRHNVKELCICKVK